MEFNWFTFAAQIINFLILVALLKRFLFRPVVGAMKQREEKIAERVEEAEQSREAAEREAEAYRRKNEELDHQREELQARAGREVDQWRKEHMQQAREEVDRARGEWYRALEREREQFLRELGRRVGNEAYKAARHILQHLAGARLEEQVVESFLERLQSIDEGRRKEIMRGLRDADHPIAVSTAFDLNQDQRNRIQKVLETTLTDHPEVAFHTEPDLICGIELKAASHKLAWSAAEHLESLQEEFNALLEESLPQSPSESEPAESSASPDDPSRSRSSSRSG